ncbi:regenerating islet-derived protein 4 [Fukomys damarensis]|uniref:regenerating islet-derived protein 4 n=1 Tax=Fukomys damarensis TaxID=885580 RepID=UPI00053F62F3|nr:regenerating islet-derived protein 4 [Fukomys damarensis]
MAPRGLRLFLLLSWAASSEVLGDVLMRPSCAAGWFYFKSSCYGYFRKLRNWGDAEFECQSYGNGTHLASVLSQKEASVISKYINGYQRCQPVWIGLHNSKDQQWQWLDGATYLYRSWSGRSSGENEHCGEMSYEKNFLAWNKNDCNKSQHFLCKYRP